MTLGFAMMKRLSSVISAAAPNANDQGEAQSLHQVEPPGAPFEQRELADPGRERAGYRVHEMAGCEKEDEESDRAEEILAELDESAYQHPPPAGGAQGGDRRQDLASRRKRER